MWILGTAILLLVGTVGPAAAQVGLPNPQTPTFVIRPVPGGPFRVVPPGTPFSRETNPFTDEPHAFNNPHPMLPNAGLGYAVRQVWMPPRPVVMQVYLPMPEGIPGQYQTMYAEVPGFYVTETTTGVVIPERWVLDEVTGGVYQWRKAPVQFVPSSNR